MSDNLLNIIIYGSLGISCIVTFFGIEARVKRTERKLKRIELGLDLILEKLEINVPDLLSEQVRELALDPQKRIAALKLYRRETGASLRESIEAIDTFIAKNGIDAK